MQKNWQKNRINIAQPYQNKLFQFLNDQNFIKRSGKKVILEDEKEYIEFLSCSYLGLDQDKRVLEAVSSGLEQTGLSFSSSRTRIKHKSFDILTDLLNSIFNAYSVFFSSTHLAHLGIIPLLGSGELPGFNMAKAGPVFLLDKTVHASIQINRGLMQQFGQVELLDFSDLEFLNQKLCDFNSQSLTPLLFSDSICSMGGTRDVIQLLSLAHRYSGYLYLDDAHGMSVYGKNGAGYVLEQFNGSFPERLLLATSLAKGFGTYGGVIVTSTPATVEFVKKYSSTYIFSGQAIMPLVNASLASGYIHLSPEICLLQEKLIDKLQLFDSVYSAKYKMLNFGARSPIRGLFIGDETAAIETGIQLKKAWLFG